MKIASILFALVICYTTALYTEDGPVTILTEKNFKDLVLNSNKIWMVEFYAPWCGHCKSMKDDWIKAAGAMGGVVHFGAVDSTVEKLIASKYEIKGFPTIKMFIPGNSNPTDYQNPRESKEFCKAAFAAAKNLVRARLSGKAESKYNGNKQTAEEPKVEIPKTAEPPKPIEVIEITSQEQFDTSCKETTCMLLIVPDIRDTGKEKREEMIAMLKAVGDKQVRGLFQYVWLVGGTQYDMEQKLNLGFGYPAIIAISGNKGRYAIQTGSFTEHNLNVFVRGLQLGSVRTSVIPELPSFVPVQPWDGLDAPIENLDDDMDEI